ncbi:hypothetical protein VQ056_09105 [Paenibacillus sp. JTLBN-2024]
MDQGDKEVARFLTYMITALQTIAGNIGEGALSVLRSPQPTPTESILTALLHELLTIPFPFILVLDDYHTASSREVDEVVCFLLNHLPTQMHLVLTSRDYPDISLPRLRVRDQLIELRAADMKFTHSEAEALFNQVMDLDLSTDQIAGFQSRTEDGLRASAWLPSLYETTTMPTGFYNLSREITIWCWIIWQKKFYSGSLKLCRIFAANLPP